ncbi:MAG: hypothetical protein HF973_12800 [Chloroflexi bacterium]|nr:hypothetical protein [Chloroflexota bacterium]
MPTTKLPDTVQEALGQQAANDLASWLEIQLSQANLPPFVQISPYTARQKVNIFVLENISNLLLAGNPELFQTNNAWHWRVPVHLTLSDQGHVGTVGEIDVDAIYGQLYYDDMLIEQIAKTAQRLI